MFGKINKTFRNVLFIIFGENTQEGLVEVTTVTLEGALIISVCRMTLSTPSTRTAGKDGGLYTAQSTKSTASTGSKITWAITRLRALSVMCRHVVHS